MFIFGSEKRKILILFNQSHLVIVHESYYLQLHSIYFLFIIIILFIPQASFIKSSHQTSRNHSYPNFQTPSLATKHLFFSLIDLLEFTGNIEFMMIRVVMGQNYFELTV